MPDHKEMGREPTEREREVAFAPHESPGRQADGDPGRRPQLNPEEQDAVADEKESDHPESQADGAAR